ncbi:MAG: GGDEF domain-containing protein [Proteobacteria bacterium]|nr:GGDEF domain-containing protein [Pseudomonadota bacterium]
MSAAKFIVALLAGIGIVAIAVVDYTTGTELRIFPLYFLPLMLAAWYFSRGATVVFAILITLAWTGTQFLGGRTYTEEWIWPVNVIAQAAVFLLVGLLFAGLRDAFNREREFARVDPLTGLPNTRSFYERVGSVLAVCHRNSESATLAYLDLDNFKQVNDRKGHHTGDQLLKSMADAMNESLRASDVAARIGGDEFVVLLAETDAEEAESALGKVRDLILKNPEFATSDVTVSIGAASYPLAPSDITEMMKAADRVMYRVKASGKNSVIVQNMIDAPTEHANVRPLRARG